MAGDLPSIPARSEPHRQPPVGAIDWKALAEDELLYLVRNGDTREHVHAARAELDRRRHGRELEHARAVPPPQVRRAARVVAVPREWFDGRAAAAGPDRDDEES